MRTRTVGYFVTRVDGQCCRWDRRDQTFYSDHFHPTVFRSQAAARNAARKATRWWARFERQAGLSTSDTVNPDGSYNYGRFRVTAVLAP